jgi:hypothetical protein
MPSLGSVGGEQDPHRVLDGIGLEHQAQPLPLLAVHPGVEQGEPVAGETRLRSNCSSTAACRGTR